MRNDMSARELSTGAWSGVLSIMMIIAGILAIGFPLTAGGAVRALIAWLLIVSGALHMAFASRAHGAGGVVCELLLGMAYGCIGLYCLFQPIAGLTSPTLVIAMYLLMKAALEVILWFQLPHVAGSGWLIGDGLVTIMLALVLASTLPSPAAWVVGALIGISMCVGGLSRLMLSIVVHGVPIK